MTSHVSADKAMGVKNLHRPVRRAIRDVRAQALPIFALTLLMLALPARCLSFSVLAHEGIIDTAWNQSIAALLKRQFPNASEDDLKDAYAYAHGGSMIQDMGYYPFGNELFSSITHLVRPGEFITALIRESRDVRELAFALGAVAHYAADTTGHPQATNRAVAKMYPKLHELHDDFVTYEDDPTAHLQTEFSFDVLQVARAGYDPDAYYNFMGFKVATDLLRRAFLSTYGLDLDHLFTDLEVAITTYRFAVTEIIPEATKLAWAAKADEIARQRPWITRELFVFEFSRRDFEKMWGTNYQRPGFFRRVIGVVIRFLPKFGPLKAFAYKPPTPEVEQLFFSANDETEKTYDWLLRRYARGQRDLPNLNFDTGIPVRAGDYWLTDDTYAELVDHLDDDGFAHVSCDLRADILHFYGDDPNAPIATKRDPDEWAELVSKLYRLRDAGAQTCDVAAAAPKPNGSSTRTPARRSHRSSRAAKPPHRHRSPPAQQ